MKIYFTKEIVICLIAGCYPQAPLGMLYNPQYVHPIKKNSETHLFPGIEGPNASHRQQLNC